ncbi:MAG TPA: translation initiation factor IF-2 [Ignavibacteriales bacterium]|nr:translation initiation factor IF-2 [Ignavibacteriales bacterium]
MPEDVKTKKVRIYKLASEYNISAEGLVEFLRKKGHEVKGIMSMLTDEMQADITNHFKKDIEKAEKHYKKISELKKKTGKADEQEVQVDTVSEPETEPEGEPITAEAEAEQPIEEIPTPQAEEVEPVEEVKPAEPIAKKEEKKAESEPKAVEPPPVQEAKTQAPVEEKAPEKPAVEEKPKVFKTVTERELAKSKQGLTVLGKMDLSKPKREERPSSQQPHQQQQQRPPMPGRPPVGGRPLTTAESEEEARKKKKKKPKPVKKGKEETSEAAFPAKKKKFKRIEIDKKDVDAAIKRTILSFDDTAVSDRASSRKKKKKQKAEITERRMEEAAIREKSVLRVTEFIAVNELAGLMDVPVGDVIAKCIGLGIMVSINQRLDFETITLVADEFGYQVERAEEYVVDVLEDKPDPVDALRPRPPVVTIMGHVDHGKTSLLDKIRSTNVVAGESGGITQHIGAYQVDVGGGKQITFLDTPGHEAFTAMRARGASVTDIVVLIVAADDAVMPQTVEAINHAQAAAVPIVIAINKIDKPGSNIDKIKQQLADRNILVEDWGGKYQTAEVSAKTGKNINELLEKILLEAEVLDLKANPSREARGAVIESQLDKGRGITATILVQKGTLRIGDPFVCGIHHGRVRAMFDERNNKVLEAGPSAPVLVLGFEGAPQAGDTFIVAASEKEAREISIKRQQLKREQDQRQMHHMTLDDIAQQISVGGIKELPLIVKGDVDGSVEALSDSLMRLSNKEVVINVIHKGVGQISESDVLLAAASGAIIIGFHVRPNLNARKLAENEKVDIRLYNIIYDAINEVKSALEGLLSPVISEETVGTMEVRDTFKVPKVGTVAGCYVQEGKINRQNKVRLIRDGIVIFTGEIDALKRFKDDVRDVDAGYECGLSIVNYNDIKIGDTIEAYKLVETKKKLE